MSSDSSIIISLSLSFCLHLISINIKIWTIFTENSSQNYPCKKDKNSLVIRFHRNEMRGRNSVQKPNNRCDALGVELPDSCHMMAGARAGFLSSWRITDNGHMSGLSSHYFPHSASTITDYHYRWRFFVIIVSILQKCRNLRFRHCVAQFSELSKRHFQIPIDLLLN